MKRGDWKEEVDGGIKVGKLKNHEKTPKNPDTPHSN